MAARSRALHDAVHAALAAGAGPVDLVEILARVGVREDRNGI